MILAEDFLRFRWVAFQSGHKRRHLAFLWEVLLCGGGFVGLLQPALAVSQITWAVLVPERVVDREREPLRPEHPMLLTWCHRSGRHPLEVWQHISDSLKLLPVCRHLRTEHSGVVFGSEPCLVVVGVDGSGVLHPLVIVLEVSLAINHRLGEQSDGKILCAFVKQVNI